RRRHPPLKGKRHYPPKQPLEKAPRSRAQPARASPAIDLPCFLRAEGQAEHGLPLSPHGPIGRSSGTYEPRKSTFKSEPALKIAFVRLPDTWCRSLGSLQAVH